MSQYLKLFLILTMVFVVACEPLQADNNDEPPRREEPIGEPEPPLPDLGEGSWWDWLKNCKPEVDIPGGIFDIAMESIGFKDKYPPAMLRSCIEQKIEEAQDKICSTREEYERIREQARSPREKQRAENKLYRLENIESRFNQRLYRFAQTIKESRRKLNDETKIRVCSEKTLCASLLRSWTDSELEALESVFESASYSECGYYSYDDEYSYS